MFKPNVVNWKPMEPSYWVQVKSIVIFNIYQHFNPNENPPSPLLVIVKRLIITTLRLSSVGWTQDRRHRSGTSTRDHFPHWKSERQSSHSPSVYLFYYNVYNVNSDGHLNVYLRVKTAPAATLVELTFVHQSMPLIHIWFFICINLQMYHSKYQYFPITFYSIFFFKYLFEYVFILYV